MRSWSMKAKKQIEKLPAHTPEVGKMITLSARDSDAFLPS